MNHATCFLDNCKKLILCFNGISQQLKHPLNTTTIETFKLVLDYQCIRHSPEKVRIYLVQIKLIYELKMIILRYD